MLFLPKGTITEIIHLINEVFAEYQKTNNITDGQIDPFDLVRLGQLEQQLAEHIERVCAKQPRETKPSDNSLYADLLMEQQEQM